ncbi:hypothetical protein ABIE78_001690 [Sinorhizobium fredii]
MFELKRELLRTAWLQGRKDLRQEQSAIRLTSATLLHFAFRCSAAKCRRFHSRPSYTSHMPGIVSAIADNIVLGDIELVTVGLGALLSFIAGAAVSAGGYGTYGVCLVGRC